MKVFTSAITFSCAAPAFLLVILLAQQAPAQKPQPCWDSAETQSEPNQCARKEYEGATKNMNRAFEALVEKYRKDAVVIEKLKASQEAWTAYRHAHMATYFPEVDKRPYGTVRPMCTGIILARLTQERIQVLQEMLDVEEGDVCAFDPPEVVGQ